jgi:hypothetical protein
MLSSVIRAAAETQHALIWPNYVFPIIAAVIFVFLGFMMHSFRDVANRHSEKTGGSTASGHTTDH